MDFDELTVTLLPRNRLPCAAPSRIGPALAPLGSLSGEADISECV